MTDFVKRKLTRGDCLKEVRPCRRHCPYRLDGEESCALDVADRGGMKQADVAKLIGVSWSRIQQIEDQALAKVCEALGRPMPARKDYATDLPPERNGTPRNAFDEEVFAAVAEMGSVTPAQVAGRVGVKRNKASNAMIRLLEEGRLVRTRLRSTQLSYSYAAAEEAEAAE